MRETSRQLKSNPKSQNPCFYFHLLKFRFILKDNAVFFPERDVYIRILNFQVIHEKKCIHK